MPVLIADSFAFSEPNIPGVDVYIGPGMVHHVMPLSWLRTNSVYLEHLKNHPERKIHLRTEEPMTFEHLRRWIQDGRAYLDFLEQFTLSKGDDEKALGDRCHLFLSLYCLEGKLQVICDEAVLIDKIVNLLRHGNRLPLQSRTIRMLVEKLHKEAAMLDYLLIEVADDLVAATGHDYDHYAELLEGPNAVPGLVKALLRRLREPRFREPPHRIMSQIMPPEDEDGR